MYAEEATSAASALKDVTIHKWIGPITIPLQTEKAARGMICDPVQYIELGNLFCIFVDFDLTSLGYLEFQYLCGVSFVICICQLYNFFLNENNSLRNFGKYLNMCAWYGHRKAL